MKETPSVWIVFSSTQYEGPWVQSLYYYKPDAEAEVNRLNANKDSDDDSFFYVSSHKYEIR